MTKRISKPQLIILLRSGVQIWVDEDKAELLKNDLVNGVLKGFAKIGGELVNTVDISGIYTPETIIELNKSKSGQWKCEHGKWIPRGKKCQCNLRPEYRDY